MKNILLVIDNLGSGGAQNQITLLACELNSRGHRVSLFTYYPQDFFKSRLVEAGVKIHHCSKKGRLGFNVILNLKKLVETQKVDILISFLDTPNFYSAIVKKLSKKNLTLIVSYRSLTNFSLLSNIQLFQRQWVNRVSDFIVTNSHHERERWQLKYPNQKSKWHTIYNAVNFNKSNVILHNIEMRKNLLVVGSVGPAKNGLIIIEALKILKDSNIIVNIDWVGIKVYNIPERKEYLNEMEQRIKNYGLEYQWNWIPPTTEIDVEYLKHKVLILASEIEGLPNVVCEAMYFGLPCIVSNVLDHPKLIENGESGFLFNPKKPIELAEAIIKVLQLDSNSYEKMCNAAKKSALKQFDLKKFVDNYESLLTIVN